MFVVTHADKPKFNNYVNVVQVQQHQSHQLKMMVRSNPSADNLAFSRVKETITRNNRSLAKVDSVESALSELIDDLEKVSWLLEPVPAHWSWSLVRDTISVHIHNASLHDAGLYVARVSNTLGDSLAFIRLLIKSKFHRFNCHFLLTFLY